jgi:hypothetical protein
MGGETGFIMVTMAVTTTVNNNTLGILPQSTKISLLAKPGDPCTKTHLSEFSTQLEDGYVAIKIFRCRTDSTFLLEGGEGVEMG